MAEASGSEDLLAKSGEKEKLLMTLESQLAILKQQVGLIVFANFYIRDFNALMSSVGRFYLLLHYL